MKANERTVFGLAVAGTAALGAVFVVTIASIPSAVSANVGWLGLLVVASMDLSPLVVLGALLLMIASLLRRERRVAIGSGLGAMLAAVLGNIAISRVVALDAPASIALIITWWLGLIVATSGGALLVTDLRRARAAASVLGARG